MNNPQLHKSDGITLQECYKHRMRFTLLTLATLLALPFAVQSSPVILAPSSAFGCKLTPTIAGADEFYPGRGKVEKNNKLTRAAGKANLAHGERLFFMGRILDERCMPVEGAHIELWQTNEKGQYRLASKGELMSPEASFAGSGTATTNNLGEFQFDTVFPAPYRWGAPHLSVRVSHPDLTPLTTNLYFLHDRRNINDNGLMKLSPPLRDRLMITVHAQEVSWSTQGLRGYTEIVLPGKEKFSQY